jgi:hypothetical protein
VTRIFNGSIGVEALSLPETAEALQNRVQSGDLGFSYTNTTGIRLCCSFLDFQGQRRALTPLASSFVLIGVNNSTTTVATTPTTSTASTSRPTTRRLRVSFNRDVLYSLCLCFDVQDPSKLSTDDEASIAGVVVGIFIAVLLIVVIIALVIRRRRNETFVCY